MKNDQVRPYYESLRRRSAALTAKRIFDFTAALLLLAVLSPVLLAVYLSIKAEEPREPALFRQIRITQYGREFRICKFRTMICGADRLGTQVTTLGDSRVTRAGHFLRKYRLDELPQLWNILAGDMSFVGTRPEVPKYVAYYTKDMWATLLLPAGITSTASITYKDEEKLLRSANNADQTYIQQILPAKMRYNLDELAHFSFWNDLKIIIRTVFEVVHP